MKTASRVMLYLVAGGLLLAVAVAQQGTTPAAPKKAKPAETKSMPAKSEPQNKRVAKGLKGDTPVPLANCTGPNVNGDDTFTFKATDKPYTVVLTNNEVFTDCDSIFKLDNVGDTKTCHANTSGLGPHQQRKSKYIAVPPNGAKDCPHNAQSKSHGKILDGSNPGDITVP